VRAQGTRHATELAGAAVAARGIFKFEQREVVDATLPQRPGCRQVRLA
jgi:hypothetical protein